MKITPLFLLPFIWICNPVHACTCLEYFSFCYTADLRPTDNIISGVIIENLEHGIRLEVKTVLRGDELRDTISVLDGTDYDCNGIISMKASQIGVPGDTVVLIIPLISSIENDWDIIGEYRMPEYLCYEVSLHIKNDSLQGDIIGYYPYSYLGNMEYDEFLESWFANSLSCDGLNFTGVGYEEAGSLQIFPNPSTGLFMVKGISALTKYAVITIAGEEIFSGTSTSKELLLDLDNLPEGIYFLQCYETSQNFQLVKLD